VMRQVAFMADILMLEAIWYDEF
jgi:hypothetical protein